MHFDVLIRGGTVVDGSGDPARLADVGIVRDRIAAVGRLDGAEAALVLDARDRAVAPGFVDVHVHSEIALLGGPHRYGGLLQGVTTHLLAPDGFGWAPLAAGRARELWASTRFAYGDLGAPSPAVAEGLRASARGPAAPPVPAPPVSFSSGPPAAPVPYAPSPSIPSAPSAPSARDPCGAIPHLSLDWPTAEAYLAEFRGRTPAHVVPQVPHCAVRLAAMGWAPRPATAADLVVMERLTREWLEAGAVCLCLGLEYQPSAVASTDELIALCRVARAHGAIYAAHIRQRVLGVPGAWRETMEIGRCADIPVHISHSFVNDVTEPLLEEAARTCDLTFESYLYAAGCTHLVLMLPQWAQAGGPDALRARLGDPSLRPRIVAAMDAHLAEGYARGARGVFAATASGRYIGLSVQEAAAVAGLPPGEFAVRALEEEPYTLLVFHHPGTPEEHLATVSRTIRHPAMLVASDGIYHGPRPHPRAYGCFARVLRLAVREQRALSLEAAVRKMSALPAERFGIPGRGRLVRGYGADVVVFDAQTVADRSTWAQPYLAPAGIDWVLVNGEVVIAHGRPTGRLPGRVLRRRGA